MFQMNVVILMTAVCRKLIFYNDPFFNKLIKFD